MLAFSLNPGQTKAMAGYELTFLRSVEFQSLNAQHQGAELALTQAGKTLGHLTPAKAFYPTRPEPMTEVAIDRFLRQSGQP